MPTAAEIFDAHRGLFGSVPPAGEDFVCAWCLGPVNPGFSVCYGCALLRAGAPPPELLGAVVPITTALSPSPWYTRLATYKAGRPDYQPILASLVYIFMAKHRLPIIRQLGGAWDCITVVPSKRGVGYDHQPLRVALSLVEPISSQLSETLRFRPDHPIPRQQYHPESFTRGHTSCEAKRLVLIEDLWVSGATALSAAGALLHYGARSVALLPIGRLIDSNFWGEGHPYREAMSIEYDPTVWPR